MYVLWPDVKQRYCYHSVDCFMKHVIPLIPQKSVKIVKACSYPFSQSYRSSTMHKLQECISLLNISLFSLLQGVIDYIFCSEPQLNVLGVLGPLDHDWLQENNISGCPHPHIPSDHFSLFAQLELFLPQHPPINGVHLPARRQSPPPAPRRHHGGGTAHSHL